MKDNLKAAIKEVEIDGIKVLYMTGQRVGNTGSAVLIHDSQIVYADIVADEDGLFQKLQIPPFMRMALGVPPDQTPVYTIPPEALDGLVKQVERDDWIAAPYEPVKAAQLYPDLAEHFIGADQGWESIQHFTPIYPQFDLQGLFFMEDNEATNDPEFRQHVEEFASSLLDPIAEKARRELGEESDEDDFEDFMSQLFGLHDPDGLFDGMDEPGDLFD